MRYDFRVKEIVENWQKKKDIFLWSKKNLNFEGSQRKKILEEVTKENYKTTWSRSSAKASFYSDMETFVIYFCRSR